ncbi:MAG: class I SAM-dependent methyltransferase [Bacteroidales bacterium]|nr:class I SAM-dependent methyltransferase [Bacteroidales bacterium]
MNYTNLIKNQISEGTLSFLRYLIRNGGPDMQDYEQFTNIVDNLDTHLIDNFREIIKESLNENTLIGHGFVKPYGYPGDFKIIDSIYKFRINKDIRYRNWDMFFQNQPAAHAVRNRKEYFIHECEQMLMEGRQKPKVLILGSGPATDVNEFLNIYPDANMTFDLIDFDQNAIDYARKQNEGFNGSIHYNRINVLRFKPYKTYDLIWSSGLFDYFKEKHFLYLVKKYSSSLNKEGTFIIGNFSDINPTKNLMEVLSDWYLNHRSVEDLWRIARQSGAKDELVTVEEEPLGINLFLKIRSNNHLNYN